LNFVNVLKKGHCKGRECPRFWFTNVKYYEDRKSYHIYSTATS